MLEETSVGLISIESSDSKVKGNDREQLCDI